MAKWGRDELALERRAYRFAEMQAAAQVLSTTQALSITKESSSMNVSAKPPRFPQLTMEQLNAEQRPLAEKIMTFSSVGIGGPYNIMLRSPVFLQRMLDLLDYLRWNTSLPLYLNEFAILIVGRRWRSQVEWYAHVPIARKAGLSEKIIASLKQKKRPEGMKDDEAIVYDFCTELAANHAVSDDTFAPRQAHPRRAAGGRSGGGQWHLCHGRDAAVGRRGDACPRVRNCRSSRATCRRVFTSPRKRGRGSGEAAGVVWLLPGIG